MTLTKRSESRKQVITRAALCVIAEEGLRAVSFRRIAARAQVPLGSLTYYFSGIEELLDQAFTLYEGELRRNLAAVSGACACKGRSERPLDAMPECELLALRSPAFFDLLAHRSRQGRVNALLDELRALCSSELSQLRRDGCSAGGDLIALHLALAVDSRPPA
ncbi:TetR family transcriptional regulator [Leucobacter allii]|uniref:TetR/AcrR family transcriptional regulator n=1 Tax=Leucobacter allii TaxID=2932247 RepID=UPI001FD02624|nr:TetR family transcriptional regulator [Leucobacter allii]UOR01253.1 TetR family transcriptional regulator [Leucobacter allii]